MATDSLYKNEKPPAIAALGALIGKYIQAIALRRNRQNAFECGALLEMNLELASLLGNNYSVEGSVYQGKRCGENTSGRMKIAAADAAVFICIR